MRFSNTHTASDATSGPPPLPWWRVGVVWLVIGGPLAVVVASLATAVLAWNGSDPVVTAPRAQVSRQAGVNADTPAQQARNHVASTTR